ncbi:MAG: hypothetical protein M0R49_07760, partial [Limnochordia bacterium]|nr:hypothetical protein [Limnochordia bacterium]
MFAQQRLVKQMPSDHQHPINSNRKRATEIGGPSVMHLTPYATSHLARLTPYATSHLARLTPYATS